MNKLQLWLDILFAKWEYGNRMVEAYLADCRGDGVARAEAENQAIKVQGTIDKLRLQ